MKGKKNILITFDYEIFLGEDSGHIEKSLIEPTEKLLSCLEENGFKAVFFVDSSYLLRLEELSEIHATVRNDFDTVCKQMIRIAEKGHFLYPHIHPHWLDAQYDPEKNSWNLTRLEKYRFSSLSMELKEKLFSDSVRILKKIIPNLVIEGYRAGGWSIQPFSSFRPFFEKYAIHHEFSVIPGWYYNSEAQAYDFTDAPMKNIYRFSDDICKEDEKGQFTEYCISVFEIPASIAFFAAKLNGIFYRLKLKFINISGDGKTVHLKNVERKDRYASGKPRKIASFENLDPVTSWYQYQSIKKLGYYHFISHPKMLSNMNIFFTSRLLKRIRKNFEVETDFHFFH